MLVFTVNNISNFEMGKSEEVLTAS